jgi:hypothetical protein
MNIPGLVKRVEEMAPILWGFLKAFTQSPYCPGNQEREGTRSVPGTLLLISASLAHLYTPRKCNALQSLLGIHLHSMGVKRTTLDLLAGLGVILNYSTIMNYGAVLAGKGVARLKELAQTLPDELVVVWDNFDYNQTVRHQTLRDPSKHVCATTGKLCIGHCIPSGGLTKSMLHLEIPLTVDNIYSAPGNHFDDTNIQCQRFWIAEAIRYTHQAAVDQGWE